jgi:hypothetical protein
VALAAAIHSYFMSPALCKRHGNAARMIAEERFGVDAMVKKYLCVYDQALENHHTCRFGPRVGGTAYHWR